MNSPRRISYIVRRGDTLSRLARRYRTSMELLMSENPHLNPDMLFPGETLIIYPGFTELAPNDAYTAAAEPPKRVEPAPRSEQEPRSVPGRQVPVIESPYNAVTPGMQVASIPARGVPEMQMPETVPMPEMSPPPAEYSTFSVVRHYSHDDKHTGVVSHGSGNIHPAWRQARSDFRMLAEALSRSCVSYDAEMLGGMLDRYTDTLMAALEHGTDNMRDHKAMQSRMLEITGYLSSYAGTARHK